MQESLITRRRILEGAVTVAATSLMPGCGSSNTAGTSSPTAALTNPQPAPTGSITQASLSVTATATGSIGSQFIGLSYDKLSLGEPQFRPSNTNLIAMFKRIGVAVLRFGDGSNITWAPTGTGGVSGQVAPSDLNNLAGFLKAADCQCIYGTNLAGAWPGFQPPTVATSPALVAAEMAYVSQEFGSQLLGVEIGNEVDDYMYAGGLLYGLGWTLSGFETLWGQFRTAILAQSPSMTFTGPAGGTLIWTVPFA